MERSTVRIVHASDLHLGTGEQEVVDRKVRFPVSERPRLSKTFWKALADSDVPFDLLVVSGDLTVAWHEDGLEEFQRGVQHVIERRGWRHTEEKHVLVVPGNHDVRWHLGNQRPSAAERYEMFRRYTQGLVRPPVPELDGADGGPPPYLLLEDEGVLVYALDSATMSGCRAQTAEKEEELIRTVKRGLEERDRKAFKELLGYLYLHDPGYVGEAQRELLREHMARLQRKLGPSYWRITKIAVLHHHVSQIREAPLEWKTFETVVDGGLLMTELTRLGFHVVLHGHKHVWHFDYELSGERYGRGLYVLGSGTIGGQPWVGTATCFNVLELGARDTLGNRPMTVRRLDIDPSDSVDPAGVWKKQEAEGHRPRIVTLGLLSNAPRGTALAEARQLHEGVDRMVQMSVSYSGAEPSPAEDLKVLFREALEHDAGADETIEREVQRVHQALGDVHTRYRGPFPCYLERVVQCVERVETELLIACDVPAYGILSSTEEYKKYSYAIRKAIDDGIAVKLLVLDARCRVKQHRRQFGKPAEFERWSKLGDYPRRLAAFERFRKVPRIENGDAFREAVFAAHDDVLRVVFDGAQIVFSATMLPVHFWVADQRRAVFAIPRIFSSPDPGEERTEEHGFETESKDLSAALCSIWRYYEVEQQRRRAAPVPSARLRRSTQHRHAGR